MERGIDFRTREVVTDQYLAGRVLTSLPDEYGYVRNCSYNQRDYGLKTPRRH